MNRLTTQGVGTSNWKTLCGKGMDILWDNTISVLAQFKKYIFLEGLRGEKLNYKSVAVCC